MDFEFDEDKDLTNTKKHGFALIIGALIWNDAHKIDVTDDRIDYKEWGMYPSQ